jgi:hypothetical protein
VPDAVKAELLNSGPFTQLAKYAAAFFTMATSACSASWRLRPALSTRSRSSTALRSCECRCLILLDFVFIVIEHVR